MFYRTDGLSTFVDPDAGGVPANKERYKMIAAKFKMAVFPILVMSLLTASPLYAKDKIVWQYSLSDIVPNTVYMIYSEEIIPARVKEATKGRLELVPLRGVVKSADVLDAVRDRRVDMGVQALLTEQTRHSTISRRFLVLCNTRY